MKEKIKNIIITISIFYMISISLLTIINLHNTTTKIYVKMKDFTKEFIELKEKVESIDNIECKNSIKKMIDKSEKYVIKEKLDLKDLRKNGSLIPEYGQTLKKCNISQKDSEYLSPYVLNSVLIYEEYFKDISYDYELSLRDIEGRIISEISMNHSKLNSNKHLEIELINKIIEVQNEE